MKPFFQRKNIKVYHGDSLKLLNTLPKESVDLVFADPPYYLSNSGFTCKNGKQVSVNKGKWDKSCGIQAEVSFHFKWIRACKRILKPNGSMWVSGTNHSIYKCGYILQRCKWNIINDVAWYKPNAPPNLSCRMFTHSHESLLWVKKENSKHFFNYEVSKYGEWESDKLKNPDKQMRSVWSIIAPKKEEKRQGKHPTQKPELLLKRIVLTSTKENDLILDPFCGSGTTGVIALRYNRKSILIDEEKEYINNLVIPRIKDEL